jgi:putative mRNA 3-end processing factor
MPSPPVDSVFLSHAHLDHSGMIPALFEEAEPLVHTTNLTSVIANLLHKDSIKIAKSEGYAPPYQQGDIRKSKHHFVDVSPGEKKHFGDNTEIRFHCAGHIPGSLMIEVQNDHRFLFTGDLNTADTHLVKGTKPRKCDVLCMEGTYAGREHPAKREEIEKEFLDKIEEVVLRGGVAVLPAFAVARSQEIAMVLRKSGLNVWFDGMGRKVSKIYLKHKEFIRSPKELKKAVNNINFIHSDHGRKLAMDADVIITSSGMMDGGPVLHYMNKLKNNPKNAVILTGYQVEGTNSHLLVERGKLDFYGVVEDVNCEVSYFDFSGHAGHSELIEFAKNFHPEKIVLMHSDNRDALVDPLKNVAEVFTPFNGELLSI